MTTPETAARQIVQDLKGTWHRHHGMARCPAHDDSTASLSVTPGKKAVLFHCFAGCSQEIIIAALRELRLNPKVDTLAAPSEPPRDLTPLVHDIWRRAMPAAGTPAQLYLDRRGIGHCDIARFARNVVTYEDNRKLSLPAILLPMTEQRRLRALLRIFVDPDGNKARRLVKAKRTLGDVHGSVIELGRPPDDTMNLAEGFEDAASAIVLNDLPGCSAVCGVERYADITIPDHVRRIVVYSQHGSAATNGLVRAHDHLTANGRTLDVVLPPPGGDWNDALLARRLVRT